MEIHFLIEDWAQSNPQLKALLDGYTHTQGKKNQIKYLFEPLSGDIAIFHTSLHH